MEVSYSHRLIDVARIFAIIACVGLVFSPTIASIGLIVTYAAFLASGEVFGRFKPMVSRPIVYWGVAFLGVVLLATLYATVPWKERLIGFYKWRTILWVLVLLALFDREIWKQRMLLAFLAVTAIGDLSSFAAAGGLLSFKRGAEGVLRNSSTQGMAFAVSTLICLWMWLEKRGNGKILWVWPTLGALYILNIVFVTPGKSGYALLGLGTGVLLIRRSPRRWWIAAGVGICAFWVVAYSLSPLLKDRVDRSVSQWIHADELPSHTPLGTRRVLYSNALEIVQENLLFGVGTGGFRDAYTEHVAAKYEVSDWRGESAGDPHNQYLSIWVQQGIIGLGVFLLWLIAIAMDKMAVSPYRSLALPIFLGWCLTSLFNSHFTTFVEGHLVATFVGILLATTPLEAEANVDGRDSLMSKGALC